MPPVGPALCEAIAKGARLPDVRTDRFGTSFSGIWPIGPLSGQPGANLADSMQHAENLHFSPYFYRVLALLGHVAHIGLVLGTASVPDATTQDQIANAKPNLCPKVPTGCAMLEPSWAQVGPSWSQLARVRYKLRPSWTKVGSCLA